MLNWLKKLLKHLWTLLKKLWPVLLLVGLAIFFLNPALFTAIISTAGSWLAAIPGLLAGATGWVVGLFNGLSFWQACAAIVGAAFLFDPAGTTAAVTDVVSTVGGVVTDAVKDVAGAVSTSFFSSPIMWVVLVGAVLYLLPKKKEDQEGRDDTEGVIQVNVEKPALTVRNTSEVDV